MDLQRGHDKDYHLFVDLIKKMMDTDPEQRIKPHEVLQHPFTTEIVPQRSFRDTTVIMESGVAVLMDTICSEYHQPEEGKTKEEEIWRSTHLSAEYEETKNNS
ncbi:homeodomain-interacting protein kinase 2-like [Xyrichtys novacula]|uniref:Homeodomain-interacting protein kinase 2-like n=1 Tax=Xyrichtys novacula TaxID=13765 RepID=A0AAV1HMC3_XYRNO|nr:homeodomain-interacting protein kinase 2-like [Xyrichtys novacula]